MDAERESSQNVISDDRIRQVLEELLKKHKNREIEFKAECRALLFGLNIADIRVCWGPDSGIVHLYLQGRAEPVRVCIGT